MDTAFQHCPPGLEDGLVFDISSEQFSSDTFRMFDFKVKPCPKNKPHDWTQCPFAHCGERATRRDPLLFNYSGSACAEFRRSGTCQKGNACTYSHGVFESWLHPTKYRTQMCSDIMSCSRRVCFFAHKPSELRSTAPQELRTTTHLPPRGHAGPPPFSSAAFSTPPQKAMAPRRPMDMAAMYPGQSAAPTAPQRGNPFSMLLTALQQIQATPGVNINVLQLLSSITGDVGPAMARPSPDLVDQLTTALLQAEVQAQVQAAQFQAQAQAHASLRTTELLREVQMQLAASGAPPPPYAPRLLRQSASLPPQPSVRLGDASEHASFASLPAVSLAARTAPLPLASSAPANTIRPLSPPAAPLPPSSSLSAQLAAQSAPSPVARALALDAGGWCKEAGTVSEAPPSAPARAKADSGASAFDMWALDPIWCGGAADPAAKSCAGSAPELLVDSATSSRGNSSKLAPVTAASEGDAAGDALLMALPRNLSDLHLSDATNNIYSSSA